MLWSTETVIATMLTFLASLFPPAAYCVSLTPFTVTAKHSSPETRSRGATNLICAARGPGDVGQGKVQY